MNPVGRYDSALKMFVDEPRDPDLSRLTFLRWLGVRNRLEHSIVGPVQEESELGKQAIERGLLKFEKGVWTPNVNEISRRGVER